MEEKKLKICLFLQRRFAFWGHALAIELKKMGFNRFCCYTLPLWSAEFLRKQKDIEYNPFLVDEEIIKKYKEEKIDFEYLKKIEKKYGIPNLLPYIFMDRYLMMSKGKTSYEPSFSYTDMLKILQMRFRAIERMFEEFQPDVVVFSAIAIMPSFIMYQVAKKKGIKVVQILNSRVKNRITVTENINEYTSIFELYKKINRGLVKSKYKKEALDFLRKFQQNPTKIYRTREIKRAKFLPLRIYKTLKSAISYIVSYYTTYRKNDYMVDSPVDYFRQKLRRIFNIILGYKTLFENPDPNDSYVFYPLHFEPEAATLVHGLYYINQINLIRNIALSLPINYKLYVKEHPFMLHKRKRSYYKKIKRIPNVCLIDAKVSSADLIKNSQLVTTITGTAGWEALLLGKPVITFGNVFYNIFSSVKRCQNIEELSSLIQDCLDNFKYNEEEIINYLSAVFEESIELDLINIWYFETIEDIIRKRLLNKLAEFIYKKITNSEA